MENKAAGHPTDEELKQFRLLGFIFWYIPDITLPGIPIRERENMHAARYARCWDMRNAVEVTEDEKQYIERLKKEYGYECFFD